MLRLRKKRMDLADLYREVQSCLDDIDVWQEGERLYSNYQKVTGYLLRLSEIHNQLSLLEITGQPDQQLKKFRTMILDPTIERLEKIGQYESRKITAMQV